MVYRDPPTPGNTHGRLNPKLLARLEGPPGYVRVIHEIMVLSPSDFMRVGLRNIHIFERTGLEV